MISFLSSRSFNTEVDGSGNQLVRAYDGTTLNTDATLEKIITPLKAFLILLSAGINRLKEKSEQTTYDDIRDDAIVALYYLLLSFSHHPKEKIKTAATSLLEIFEQYGIKMQVASYTTESSLVNSLLTDYTSPEALANIALVPQGAEYVAALQKAQSDFGNIRLSFEEARGKEGTVENATAIKKEVLNIINKQLVPYLNVMVQLEETSYGDYARTIAEIIATNNEQVKKRRNKGKKSEEEETEDK